MSGNNLDIALRIKAELDQARGQVEQFNQTLEKTGGSARLSGDALKSQTAAVRDLFEQIDPTIAKLAKLDDQLAQLRAAKSRGLIDDDEFARFSASIDKSRADMDKAGAAMHGFSLNTSMARMEVGRLGKDIATGQWGRLLQTSMTLANYSGLMNKAFSATGASVLGLTVLLGAFAAEVIKGALQEEVLNKAIITTGNFAGTTTAQIDLLATRLGGANGKIGEAREILGGLVASGRITGTALEDVGRAAVNMAELSGKSAKEVVAEFSKMADDPVRAARELDAQYHVLTASIYLQIQTLQDAGKNYEALQLLAKTFADETGKRMDELHGHMSWLERFASNWDNNGFARIGRWANDLGRPASEVDKFSAALKKYNDTYEAYQTSLKGSSTKDYQDHLFALSQKAYAELQAAQAAAQKVQTNAKNEGADKQAQADGMLAVERLHSLEKGYDKVADKQAIVKKLNADLALQWKTTATLPAGVDMAEGGGYSGKGYDYLVEKALGESTKPKKPRSTDAVEREAAAAQAQLIKLLGDEQGKVDPVAKAWAAYNDKVTEANKLADKAKLAKGANVVAIDAERDALIKSAAAARDADLAKPAIKAREEFEKLRDTLKTTDGISLGHLKEQMKLLEEDLAKGVITAKEYRDTLDGLANQGIDKQLKKLPQPTVAGSVGGPFGELDKINNQQQSMEETYRHYLALLNAYHDAHAKSDADFIAKENALYKDHAETTQAFEDQRAKLMLMGITSSFASAADAIKQGFGAQSGAYKAAFALSKAAAIAQASVNMYLDISQASAKGWPQNIPLIAQAMAEGMTIIGSLRSVSAGFSAGGYTGAGASNEVAGYAHKGEWVQPAYRMIEPGAMAFMHDFQQMGMAAISAWSMPGYADGGFVSPLHDAPRLPASSIPRASFPTTAANDGQRGGSTVGVRIVNQLDPQVTFDAMNSTDGEAVIMNVISRNTTRVRQMVR